MASRFQRNYLLVLLATGVVAQVLTLLLILHVIGREAMEDKGQDTARLAAIAARTVNGRIREAARTLERYDLSNIWPAATGDGRTRPLSQPIIADSPSREWRFLIARDTRTILWQSATFSLSQSALQSVLDATANDVVAILPSADDRLLLFARKVPPPQSSPAEYIVVAVGLDGFLSSAVSVLGQDKSPRLLLADSSGRVLAGTVRAELPAAFYSQPYTIVPFAAKSHIASSARIEVRPSPNAFWSVVVLRDMQDALASYEATRGQIITLEIVFLLVIIAVAFKVAQHLAGPVETLRQGLEVMTGANPDYRIKLASGDELETIAEYANQLADSAMTAKRELEEEIAAATRAIAFEKEKLASILFGLGDGVIVCDHDLRVILCNRAARSVLTTRWKQARRGKGIYNYLDASRLKPLVEALGEGPRAGKQATFTLSSGAIIQAAAAKVNSADDTNYIFLLRDVTQLVNLDRQKNRAINQMVQSLRSPLSSILSCADILCNYNELNDRKKEHFLGVIREEVEGLSQKLDEMQKQAELALSPIEWSVEDVDIGAFAHQVAQELRPLAEDRLVRLVAAGEAAIVRGDPLSLRQVVGRLFEFCLGFASEGGQIEAQWAEAESGWVELRISYTGRPLSSEEIESIFENPLYIGSEERGRLPSSGDVATIREIVKQHGGEVWAKNGDSGASLALIMPARVVPLVKRVGEESDTVGKQIMALLGDGAFYDFRLDKPLPVQAHTEAPLNELSYVVFDLETTGLHPKEGDEIIAVGAIRIDGGEIVKEDYFYTLVNPGRPVPASSTRVHGISDGLLVDQPTVEEVIPKFLQFVGDSILVGHFLSFDLSFLEPKMTSMGLGLANNLALDTLLLSYALFKDWEAYNLEDLANHLGVKIVARHTALGDAYATAQILLQLVKIMEGRGIRTLGEALRMQSGDIVGRFLRIVQTSIAGV